jgi:hypothetical protein
MKSRALEPELEVFERHRQEWLPLHADKFAVVSGTTVAGFYPDFPSAYRAALQRFGICDILIKQVCAQDPVYVIY